MSGFRRNNKFWLYFHGRKLYYNEDEESIFELCISISKFTFDDIESRFPSTDFFNNFKIFDIAYLTNALIVKNKEFEQDKLSEIAKFLYEDSGKYKFKIQEIFSDWNAFKEIFKYYLEYTKKNPEQFYNLLMDHQKEISNLIPLIEFYFSIQSNTAECERGFSRMNNIKTKSRNCMDIETLDYLIRVSTAEEVILIEIYDESLF